MNVACCLLVAAAAFSMMRNIRLIDAQETSVLRYGSEVLGFKKLELGALLHQVRQVFFESTNEATVQGVKIDAHAMSFDVRPAASGVRLAKSSCLSTVLIMSVVSHACGALQPHCALLLSQIKTFFSSLAVLHYIFPKGCRHLATSQP